MDEANPEVILTSGFRQRLLEIEQFLEAADAGFAFDQLIDELEDTVIPNLRRFPRMGRFYARRAFVSAESQTLLSRLPAAQAESLREYLHGDYLILYAFMEDRQTVYLLTIRHHRQLSFDFPGLWPAA